MTMTPRQVADLQLETYNRHDLPAFCALFDQKAQLIDLPSGKTVASGIKEIEALYRARFNIPELQCRVHTKTDLGNFAIDRETVYGLPAGPVDVVAMYEVIDSKIHRIFFIREQN